LNFAIKRRFVAIRQELNELRPLVDGSKRFDAAIIVIAPTIILWLTAFLSILNEFQNSGANTGPFTNIAFAVLAGIAAVCFSWASRLEKEKGLKMYNNIIHAGELAFHSAIIFLCASSIKYVNSTFSANSSNILIKSRFLEFVFAFCFLYAYVKALLSLTILNYILFWRLSLKVRR
jgi:hypothetical protein